MKHTRFILFGFCCLPLGLTAQTDADAAPGSEPTAAADSAAMADSAYVARLEDSIVYLQDRIEGLELSLKFERERLQQQFQGMEARYHQARAEAHGLLLEREMEALPFYAEQVPMFNNRFDVLVVKDLEATELELFWCDADGKPYGSFASLEKALQAEGKELLFAANAGMYEAHRQGSKPKGLYVEEGKEQRPLDQAKEGYGNFYMQPNGIFLIDHKGVAHVVPTDSFGEFKKQVQYATQSGPMLVSNNLINHHFNAGSSNLHIRNGVGVTETGEVVFIISRAPVNFYDFATIFRDQYHCTNALYLDGAISKTFLPALGRQDAGGGFGPMIGIWRTNPLPNDNEEDQE